MKSRLGADDLHLFNEGTHYRLGAQARRPHDHLGPQGRDGLRRLGPQRPRGVGGRRLERLGERPRPARPARRLRDLGGLRARGRPRRRVQVRDLRRAGRAAAEGRPVRRVRRAHRRAPARGSGISTTTGRTRPGWQARAGRSALDAPISIYELHLGSWRRRVEDGNRPLTYLRAGRAAAGVRRRQRASPTSSCCRSWSIPFYGSWGYQTTGYFAPTSRYGTPQDFMCLIDALHRPGIGVILDWVPSHFPTDAHGLALLRRHAPVRARRPAPGLPPRLGQLHLQLRPQRGAELPALERAALARPLPRRRPAGRRRRLDALPRLLAQGRASGSPTSYGGRENLEAIDFLRALQQRPSTASIPDVQTYAEESTAWPMVSRPTYLGGLGFGLKWDMGWMHDTLGYFERGPDPPPLPPPRADVPRPVRLHRELRAAALPRRGRARQGLAARQDARERVAEARQPARALRLPVRAARARSCSSWAASSGSGTSGITTSSLDWHLLDQPEHEGMPPLGGRPEPRLPRPPGAARARLRPGRVRVGARLRQRVERARVPAPRPRRRATRRSRSST